MALYHFFYMISYPTFIMLSFITCKCHIYILFMCIFASFLCLSRALFSIKQVKHVLPLDSLRTLYFALIHLHLSYGIIAWGNADMNLIRLAKLLQKRAIRVINKAPFNSHTDPKFKKSGILKLNDLVTVIILPYHSPSAYPPIPNVTT